MTCRLTWLGVFTRLDPLVLSDDINRVSLADLVPKKPNVIAMPPMIKRVPSMFVNLECIECDLRHLKNRLVIPIATRQFTLFAKNRLTEPSLAANQATQTTQSLFARECSPQNTHFTDWPCEHPPYGINSRNAVNQCALNVQHALVFPQDNRF